ncbi:hypothetical protein MMC17_008397 [Xylographa soralifera]|nr:hypothetical protein [Xylographa soralifera]
MSSSTDQVAPRLLFRREKPVPPPKVTGEEMEGVRPADPKVRADYNAEKALLALFRIDLAIMHTLLMRCDRYKGGWVPKQLKHMASHNNIYEPIDLPAYTEYVIERAVRFIQTERCDDLQHTNRVAQSWNGVARPKVAPFTPIFEGPVHDAAYLYELVRQGRHPNRRVSLHRTLELAEQCIYKLLQRQLALPELYSFGEVIERFMYCLWVDGNHMDVATIWEYMAQYYKLN